MEERDAFEEEGRGRRGDGGRLDSLHAESIPTQVRLDVYKREEMDELTLFLCSDSWGVCRSATSSVSRR